MIAEIHYTVTLTTGDSSPCVSRLEFQDLLGVARPDELNVRRVFWAGLLREPDFGELIMGDAGIVGVLIDRIEVES